MTKTTQNVPAQGVVKGQAEQPSVNDKTREKLSAIGAPPVESRTAPVGQDVAGLLDRAGLQRHNDGSLAVKDAAAIHKSDAGLSAAERLSAESGPSGATGLKPPVPPRIQLTEALKVGAETFAANIDQLTNGVLFKNGAMPLADGPALGPDKSPFEVVNYLLYSNQLSADSKGLGTSAAAAGAEQAEAGDASGAKVTFDPKTGQPLIDPKIKLEEVLTPENIKAVMAAAEKQSLNLQNGLRTGTVAGVDASDVRSLTEMSADLLLAMFLKLNISDPNNSVKTHNELHELSSNLRQTGIKEAQQRAKTADALKKEAQAYADKVQIISKVIKIVMIIISIVLAIFTFGAGLAIIGPVLAALEGLATTVIKIVLALITMILQIVQAKANQTASNKSSDASAAKNDVNRARLQAEKAQKVVEEEAAIIKVIMESKNQMVDAVVKMINAMFSTQTKVMSAGMAR